MCLLLKMAASILTPPSAVRGMTVLNRAAFTKKITVPSFTIQTTKLDQIRKAVKPYLLKLEKFQPVSEHPDDLSIKTVLLSPDLVKSMDDLKEEDRKRIQEAGHEMSTTEIEVGYDNWRSDLILRAVLPPDEEGTKGFSVIGHIVHLNLHDHLLPYKNLIGQVLLDKSKNIRTVVNKVDTIENTYRNFQMEVLAGENDLIASLKENNCEFKLDFGQVYWNPRLSTEHHRVVELIGSCDIVYDVFAGIGPFSIPAAKKGARVLANDLNPESFKWLEYNVKNNKMGKRGGSVKCVNKDGRDFILQNVKTDLQKVLEEENPYNNIHIVMNLPALATTFLDALRGLLPNSYKSSTCGTITVHVYCFARDFEPEKLALELVEKDAGFQLGDNLIELKLVRKVAPSKFMARLSFKYSLEKLCEDDEEPAKKKLCIE